MEDRKPLQIRRKPVPISPVSPIFPRSPPPEYTEWPVSVLGSAYSGDDSSLFDQYAERPPPRPQFLTVDDHLRHPSPAQPLRATRSSPNLQQTTSTPTTDLPQPSKPAEVAQKAGKAFVTAFEEARHFAGGLISHPYESTKHFSILRHSHGLVFYSGSHTSIAITVFGDRELPPDRSFWLQRKGWSGNTGLKAGALFGTHSAWLNVTPSVVATADQVKPSDERAWQRDIGKFLSKAPTKIADHVPRETEVLRIPCEAEDGYLRIVMCSGENGKKTLCPSPVFRLASTSLEGSSMRGASLKTLPLEAAVKIGTTVGTQVANRVVGPYVQTAKTFVSTTTGSIYQPTATQMAAARGAYDSSGLSDRFDAMNDQYALHRAATLQATPSAIGSSYTTLVPPMIVGNDSGPEAPFPVRFSGKPLANQHHQSPCPMGFPTATLTNIPSDITLKHPTGIYIGHASPRPPTKLLGNRAVEPPWHAAIITIAPLPTPHAAVVQKKTIHVTLLATTTPTGAYDDADAPPPDLTLLQAPDAKISVLLLAFLRPLSPSPLSSPSPSCPTSSIPFPPTPLSRTTTAATTISSSTTTSNPQPPPLPHPADIPTALTSLARPAWRADAILAQLRAAAEGRSLADRYVALREGVQGGVDRVPVHRVGVRTEGMGSRDRWVGTGGVCILR